MKKILVLAMLVLSFAVVSGCGKKDNVLVEIDEDTTKIAEANGEIFPGPDQTSVIINMVEDVLSNKSQEKLAELSAYTDADETVLNIFDEIFGRKIESGAMFVNSFIENSNVKAQADIDKLNADLAGKLKGTVTEYNIVTVSVSENDEGEMKDVLMPMVLIDSVWYVLDVVAG